MKNTCLLENNFLPLISKIEEMLKVGKVVLAIEGGSASGKTTLAKKLEDTFDACVFHVDDFFLQKEQRTTQRLNEIGGNFDRERFKEEIITPLVNNQKISYRKFDCKTLKLSMPIESFQKNLTIIEGVYSTHPYLEKYYTFSVFLKINNEKQHDRILKRNNAESAKRFFEQWIPKENAYFKKYKVESNCNIVINV